MIQKTLPPPPASIKLEDNLFFRHTSYVVRTKTKTSKLKTSTIARASLLMLMVSVVVDRLVVVVDFDNHGSRSRSIQHVLSNHNDRLSSVSVCESGAANKDGAEI